MDDFRRLELEKYAALEELRLAERKFADACERLAAAVAGTDPFDYWLRRQVNALRSKLGLRLL